MDEDDDLQTWAFLVRTDEDDEIMPTELGERLAQVGVLMTYVVPPEYSVEGLTRDSLVMTTTGLWWQIRTMGRKSWNTRGFVHPRGFVPWWTITAWAVHPRRRSRKELEIHHVLHLDRPAILKIVAKSRDVDELTEMVRRLLPDDCMVYEDTRES